ncbi:hypothetical protein ASE21_08685 [Flavobacterium sp. Root901]|nr:hypothetical protein ASE21_08685 [Flavobacterium sp. Root901]
MTTISGIVNNSDVTENITYFDGLGRPIQKIDIKASPSMKDVITHISYDEFGRKFRDYLPYMDTSSSLASYRIAAETNTNAYYISNFSSDVNSTSPNPFSQKVFESSPLNRTLQQGAPGKDWALGSGHEIKTDYQTNISNEVKYYVVTTVLDPSGIYVPTLTNPSNYDPGQLIKTINKDENWTSGNNNTTEEFKDNRGNIILKRSYNAAVAHDTYYIYDIFGNLTYVLPPKANGAITTAVLNDLCYQYRYDSRNRIAEKKLPGKDWEYIIYDKLDRLILTQDANLRAVNKWMFTKYDAFNRTVYTGEYVNATQTTRAAVQTLADAGTTILESKLTTALTINGTVVNYTNNAFPISGIDLLTINYYDDYLNINLEGGASVMSYGVTPITNAKGLTTCTKVRVLGTSNWITTANYYDSKGRSIYYYNKNNYLNTVNTVKYQLDFGGNVLETTTTHLRTGIVPTVSIQILDVFTYDHAGRLLTQKQTINNQQPELIVSNTYDNLGQLISKGVGGKIGQSRLQSVDYSYNIRGWLKNINDVSLMGTDLFALKINYNTPTSGSGLFNGNISQTQWKTTNEDSSLKSYLYTYDSLNRLTLASDVSANNPGRYNESLSYDKNGNITNLARLGNTNVAATTFGNMDILTYTYDSGNRLTKVEDAGSVEGFSNGSNIATEYTYDNNGNMKTDANKGITSILYNYLDLPIKLTFASGTIDYIYDAAGIKQRKIVTGGKITDYADSFIYEDNILQFFSQSEGYVANNSGIFNYIYQYEDHLGNVRLSFDQNLNVIEENNYYPFGLKQKGYNIITNSGGNSTAQKYKYNSKEWQDDNIGAQQLNLYDYGARNYDPALGRWMNIDPLIELMRDNSTYGFAFNNPIYFEDYDGLIPIPQIVKSMRISSSFGLRMHPIKHTWKGHAGIDLTAGTGNDVKSAAIGTIAKVGWDPDGYGKYIVVKHINGYYTLYAHLSKVNDGIKIGESVGNGESIGKSGSTGGSTGPHLHFEIINAQSLAEVFNKANKIDPNTIYDLNDKLYPKKSSIFNFSFDSPSFNFSDIMDLEIPSVSIPNIGTSSSSSSSSSKPTSKLTSVSSISPASVATPASGSPTTTATVRSSTSSPAGTATNSSSKSSAGLPINNFKKSPLL